LTNRWRIDVLKAARVSAPALERPNPGKDLVAEG